MNVDNTAQPSEQQPEQSEQTKQPDRTAQLEAQIVQLQQQVIQESQRASQANAYVAAFLQQQAQPQQPQQQTLEYDPADPESVKQYINAQVALLTAPLEQRQFQLRAQQEEMQLHAAVSRGVLTADELNKAKQQHEAMLKNGTVFMNTATGQKATPTLLDSLSFVVGMDRAEKAIKTASAFVPQPVYVETPGGFAGGPDYSNAASGPKRPDLDNAPVYDPATTAKLGEYLDKVGW